MYKIGIFFLLFFLVLFGCDRPIEEKYPSYTGVINKIELHATNGSNRVLIHFENNTQIILTDPRYKLYRPLKLGERYTIYYNGWGVLEEIKHDQTK